MKSINNLVLSIFPGIDLLDRAFEQVGFCVVSSPDPALHGTDRGIENFHPPAGHLTGVIAGSPCQDFSCARRGNVTELEKEKAKKLIAEGARVILKAQPNWWLWENVPSVPSIKIEGYTHQRFDLCHNECGGKQLRRRHFQFGVKTIWDPESIEWWGKTSKLIIPRAVTNARQFTPAPVGERSLETPWPKLCTAFDLPENFKLPAHSRRGAYRAVRNGVPLRMGVVIARAIKNLMEGNQVSVRICICGCGRPTNGQKQSLATPACRKRMERWRKNQEQETLYFRKGEP